MYILIKLKHFNTTDGYSCGNKLLHPSFTIIGMYNINVTHTHTKYPNIVIQLNSLECAELDTPS